MRPLAALLAAALVLLPADAHAAESGQYRRDGLACHWYAHGMDAAGAHFGADRYSLMCSGTSATQGHFMAYACDLYVFRSGEGGQGYCFDNERRWWGVVPVLYDIDGTMHPSWRL